MASGQVHAQSLFIVGLMLLSSLVPLLMPINEKSDALADEIQDVKLVGEGDQMDITLTSTPNFNFKLDLPNAEPLVSAELQFTPKVLPTQSGFVWDDANDWNHPDAITNSSTVNGGALTGSGAGMLWDFNANNQGWTFSGYGAWINTPSCGMNGSTGGSLRTYAGSSYATSPVVNLAGGVNVPFHAWVLQGSSSCGEEPDSSEDLSFQYVTSTGTWVTFSTFYGSTSGGTATSLQVTLPSAAVHSASQFRIYQNSGSGTCCDFWFVDDVHIAVPPESNWTSPSIGHKVGSTQMLAQDTYAPLYIEADIPTGSYLNWTLLDSNNNSIPGMSGSNDVVIPVDLLDYTSVAQFRIYLEFVGSSAGIPKVYSIAGDGAARESFRSDPTTRGWELNGSAYGGPGFGITGDANDSLTSPWMLANAPVYDAQLSGSVSNAQVQVRFHPQYPWTNVTLPYTPIVNQDVVGMQIRVVALPTSDGNMSNFTGWSANSLHVNLLGGQVPAQPTLDFNLDQRLEWGGYDARVGAWGWQNRFVNAQEQTQLSLTAGSPSIAKLWVPRDDLNSFRFSYVALSGNVQDVALYVANDFIANRSYPESKVGVFSLNASEHLAFKSALSNIVAAVDILGSSFTEVRIEVKGTGTVALGGLRATHNASHTVVSTSSSPLVMAVNEARTTVPQIGGMQSIPFPMLSSGRGGLTIRVLDAVTSSDVQLHHGQIYNAPTILVPGKSWNSISSEYRILGGSITSYRLDVYSKEHHATWIFPSAGGAPIGLGDSELVQLHPSHSIVKQQNGSNLLSNITFRIRPDWDDTMQLTVTSRVMMQDGVFSIPFSHTWGSTSSQGYDNDLKLQGVVYSENGVAMSPTRKYLRGGEYMDLSVQVGFEGSTQEIGFVDGDALLTLYRNDVEIRNTSAVVGAYWNFTELIPFTYGDVTWTVRLQSLNGSSVVEPSEISRTFSVDSVKPRVIDASMRKYDHREPSPTQVIQITIMDQPVLPSSVVAMVWKEWVDDDNFNGWPDEGEYQARTLLLPSDLTALTGVYTLMHDDTSGSVGQKVAIYLDGTDPSGYPIQGGGSAAEGDQLFIYQLAQDGKPSIDANAFNWIGGRKTWLHPGQPYELNAKIIEPNGGSDLSSVEVLFANNQPSDNMSILWTFESSECTTVSTHIIIESCTMLGSNGLAGPFDKDLTLNVQLRFGWNTPDLGETKREPAIKVVDKAGQEEVRSFPEQRWQFSAGMSIPEESVQLHLSKGAFLGDGARVTPLTTMEISGGVVFTETSIVPQFDCQINVLFAGQTYSVTAKEGVWSVPVQAPAHSGSVPMTWEVGCLHGQGVDLTNQETSVKWIVVDGTGPLPLEVLSPRPMAILGGEQHEVRVVVSELGGLDVQSLELIWQVVDYKTGDLIRSGREPLTLDGHEPNGLRLELYAEMDLSSITKDMLIDRMVVKIAIEGRDLAGNEVTGLDGDLADLTIATWNMEWLQPQFELEPTALTYSRLLMVVGDTTSIQLEVENAGTLAGRIGVVFEAVSLEGERTLVHRTSVDAEAGSVGLISVDWKPVKPGFQWVEATLDNGQKASGPTIDVRVAEEPTLSQKVFGDVNPLLGGFTALLLVMVVFTLLAWMKRMTVNQGSKVGYDWDEYSSELEDEADNVLNSSAASLAHQQTSSNAALSSSAVQSGAPQQQQNDSLSPQNESASQQSPATDWVMGADGYWWYHDKAENQWWYKDAQGNIVKHP